VTPNRIFAPIADDLRRVEQRISERIASDVALVRQVAAYLVGGGGKRLRPALLLLAAGAVGARDEARIELAAVVEFIHTATLLHDDVVDASELRRGRSTANAEFGNAAAVLVGDFLYSRAFQMMVSVDRMRVMSVLAQATNAIAEGEVLQLMNCRNPDVDENGYLEVVRRKTAKLFEASARLGAVLGGAPPVLEERLAEYGVRLGTAFQLVDDVLDYSGDAAETGKQLGDDLAEGKPTLPLIRAMACAGEAQARVVREAIAHGGRAAFAEVLAIVRATGALEYARALAQREADAAAAAVAVLAPSAHRDSLLELASFSVSRRA
jgi:octaprenyl-diphosphate synthase